MGVIFEAILDAIGDSIKKWAKKTGKPVFGIGCLIAAVLFFVFAVKSGLSYIDYMSKPNRFSVDESILAMFLDTTYVVDGETYTYETKEKGIPVSYTHEFWRDENGVVHTGSSGGKLGAIVCLVLGFLAIYFGILDIKQFYGVKNGNFKKASDRKKKSKDEARAIVELNKRDRERKQ